MNNLKELKIKEHFEKHDKEHPNYVLCKPGKDLKDNNYLKIEVNPYDLKTVDNFLKVNSKEEENNRIKHLFKFIIDKYDLLALDNVIDHLENKGKNKSTLNKIKTETEKGLKSKENLNISRNLFEVSNYLSNVQAFYEKNPFFYDKYDLFWFWNSKEHKYEIVDTVDLMNEIEDALFLYGQTINSKTKSSYIEAFKRVGRKNHPEEAPAKWIQFKDKAYSLNSGNIYKVMPNYFFTNPIPWEMGESSETPTMDKMFEQWVGKEYVQTLYEIIAYCCYTEYPIHRIFALIGGGCNGKSTFQQLLRNFIGVDNCTATELDILLDSRFESAKLYKKLACIMGETNFGVMAKTSLLKKLSGQDLIGFEYKNKKPFESENYAKLLINSNSMPTSDDTSEGFYRRWIIIDFPNKFKEGRDILKDIPEHEYNNLAKKVTEMLPKLLENGYFSNEGSIEERQKKYIEASNPLSLFFNENVKEEIGGFIRYSELYTRYVQYLKKKKKRIVSKREFSKSLDLEGIEITRTSKKIDDMFVNDRYVENHVFCDSCDSCDRHSNLFPYRESSSNLSHKCHKSHKEMDTQYIVPEERIYHECTICSTDTADKWYKGKPICQLCMGTLISNGENKENFE